MTQNQLRYQELKEEQRSNLARETETNRSNLANELETNRSNLAKELETNRANLAKEKQAKREFAADTVFNTLDNVGAVWEYFLPSASTALRSFAEFVG
jgi:vacuolar-type H+-ATPase subunit I/STV1